MASLPPRPLLQAVAQVCRTLAGTERLVVLQELLSGPQTVTELAAALGLKQATVSQHLGRLLAIGFVSRERNGGRVRYAVIDPTVVDLFERMASYGTRPAYERRCEPTSR